MPSYILATESLSHWDGGVKSDSNSGDSSSDSSRISGSDESVSIIISCFAAVNIRHCPFGAIWDMCILL